MDRVRVLRIIEYTGPRGWVEYTVKTAIQGEKYISDGCCIRGTTLGTFPEILDGANPEILDEGPGQDKQEGPSKVPLSE